MRRLAEDAAHWQRLRAAGLARAAQFSWPRCARETLAVYRKVLA
jgi:alpha-1,3-rhamnosyl/mannosyltransferase